MATAKRRLRRRCDGCKRQYDYTRSTARYCSKACRQTAYRQRRAERDLVEAERLDELRRTYDRIGRDLAARRRAEAAAAAAPPEPVPVATSERPEIEPCACIGRHFGHSSSCPRNPNPPPARITIYQRTAFPGTRLPRRNNW